VYGDVCNRARLRATRATSVVEKRRRDVGVQEVIAIIYSEFVSLLTTNPFHLFYLHSEMHNIRQNVHALTPDLQQASHYHIVRSSVITGRLGAVLQPYPFRFTQALLGAGPLVRVDGTGEAHAFCMELPGPAAGRPAGSSAPPHTRTCATASSCS
jgi:hypothetical protein